MQFNYSITVDYDTPIVTPERLTCETCRGILKRMFVYFPFGCASLVGVRILHYEHQLFPTNPGAWLTGDNIEIGFECDYQIDQGEHYFHLEGYNLDDYYTHTPIVIFVILPAAAGAVIPPRVVGV